MGQEEMRKFLERLDVNVAYCSATEIANLVRFLTETSGKGKSKYNAKRLATWKTTYRNLYWEKVKITGARGTIKVKGAEIEIVGQIGRVIAVGGPTTTSITVIDRLNSNQVISKHSAQGRNVAVEDKFGGFKVTVRLDCLKKITLSDRQIVKHLPPPVVPYDHDVDHLAWMDDPTPLTTPRNRSRPRYR
jgi:hypothetical protein